MRDNADYRAANTRAQTGQSVVVFRLRRAEHRGLQRFVRTDAARDLPAVPVTGLPDVAAPPAMDLPTMDPPASIPWRWLPPAVRRPSDGHLVFSALQNTARIAGTKH